MKVVYEAGTEQFRLCACSLEKRSLGVFGFVFDSGLCSSSVESCRTFVVSENYLLLASFF